MLHRHVCSCGDWRFCTERDCLPWSFEQCPECQQQEQDEIDRERAYRARIAMRGTQDHEPQQSAR
jgi:hypothetical protein